MVLPVLLHVWTNNLCSSIKDLLYFVLIGHIQLKCKTFHETELLGNKNIWTVFK